MGGMLTCSRVIGLSKYGHRIEKYTHNKRLAKFRPGWVPDHLLEKIDWRYESKAAAAQQADFMRELFMGIRQFSRDGKTLLRDGATGGAVWIRARSIWANKL
jgi:hypothetical protein